MNPFAQPDRVTIPMRLRAASIAARGAVAAVLLGFLAAPGCGGDAPPPPEPAPDIATKRSLALGDVVGFVAENGAHVWRGLPFAAPPVGELRWKAPRPPAPWPGVREALAFGDGCVQFAGPGAEDENAVKGSEDCLYLNVFAPPFAPGDVPEADARKPVMVWIHGGGNSVGDADLYDGANLAVSQDVIVVAIHYRLGLLGWFAHDALHTDGASADDRSGNYGTLDTIRALEWVREHVASFGGDPGRVTIFGESAGGSNVFALLISPRAKGLFHRAIVQSGSGTTSPMSEATHAVDDSPAGLDASSIETLYAQLVAAGEASDRDAAKARAAGMSKAEVAAFLRSRSAEDLLAPHAGAGFGGMYYSPRLLRDGHVLPEDDARVAIAAGRYNAVPTIFGTNRDENKLFSAFGSKHVTRVGPVPLWFSNERMYDLSSEYGSNVWKAKGADEAAEAAATAGLAPAWVYRFDWDEEGSLLWIDFSRLFGAAHALEIPFVFGLLELGDMTDWVFPEESREGVEQLSERMMGYWGRFARTGDPNGVGAPKAWPAWKPGAGEFLIFDSEAGGGLRLSDERVTRESMIAAVATDARFESDAERCEIWGEMAQYGRAMTAEAYREVGGGVCKDIPIPE